MENEEKHEDIKDLTIDDLGRMIETGFSNMGKRFDAVDERLSFPSAVLRAVANLPNSERELLILRLVEQRPYVEIAQRLQCTPVAARLRVSRSLRRLHLALGGF